MAAGAVGVARRTMYEAISAKERETMLKTMGEKTLLSTKLLDLSDMATGIEAARLLTYKSAFEVSVRESV